MPMPTPQRDRLPRSFFACPAQHLAPRLLGHRLVRVLNDGTRLAGVIVETEAYLGAPDMACHTFAGRRTPRNEAMYGPPGTAYVYFTYGMHHCMNIVCGTRHEGVAVLIRALEPLEGHDQMQRHRRLSFPRTPFDLCGGPAKLCQALAIDLSWNGVDLVEGASLFLERGSPVSPRQRRRTPRVGIDGRGEWTGKLLRWYVKDSPYVSVRGRPPTRAAESSRGKVRPASTTKRVIKKR